VIFDAAGKKQLVLSGSKCVASYDPDNGKLIWMHDGPTEQYVASLVYHQGILFLTTGFPEYHLMGIRPDGEGNITKTKHVAWHIGHRDNGPKGAAYVPSPLAHDGHFFVISDAGYLGCVDPDGMARFIECANIITRTLITFSQAALLSHPYFRREMEAAFGRPNVPGAISPESR